jgi:hydrogenase maturation factor
MDDILAAAEAADLVLLGGHTEVTAAVRLPWISVTMFGMLLRSVPVRTGDGRPGDAIVQVNPFGLEGTSILATESRELLAKQVPASLLERAARFCYDPGLSVVRPAILATTRLGVHAMHDPTEGGIATGLRELAAASDTGCDVDEAAMLVTGETRDICRILGVDPLGLISSGCLLFTLPASRADRAVCLLRAAGYPTAVIGSLTPVPGRYRMHGGRGGDRELPCFQVDELAAARS